MINQAVQHSTPSHIYMCIKKQITEKAVNKSSTKPQLHCFSCNHSTVMVKVYVRTGIYDMVIKKNLSGLLCFHIVFLYVFFSLTSACRFKTNRREPTGTKKPTFFDPGNDQWHLFSHRPEWKGWLCDLPLNPDLQPSRDERQKLWCTVQLLWSSHIDMDGFTLDVLWSLVRL